MLTSFNARVAYAAACFQNGETNSRTFDSCFECFDGDAVVVALVRQFDHVPGLKTGVSSWAGGNVPNSWTALAEKYRDLPDDQLEGLAADLRRRNKAAWCGQLALFEI